MLRQIGLIGVVAAELFFSGCSDRDDFKLSYEDLQFENRASVSFPTNPPKFVAQMRSNDVIVAVNGYPLRKYVYDDLIALKLEGLLEKNKDANNVIINEQIEEFRKSYVKNFQGQWLLVDDAFRQGLISTNEVLRIIEKRLKDSAHKRGKSIEQSLAKFGDKKKYLLQEMYVSIVMDRLISKRIPPKCVVTDRFVEAVQKQIEADNVAAKMTNGLLRARLGDWKQQIITNRLEFTTVAQRFSHNPDPDGIWGVFEADQMDDPRIATAVFSLPVNAISDVLEDDDGLYLVKVLSILPPEKDKDGNVLVNERRKLSRIYWEKMPMELQSSDVQMTQELKRQMQLQAINDYVRNLFTNSSTKVEFPNGNRLF